MTVGELIDNLKWFDRDAEIRIAQPTHNYWHEIEAREIGGFDDGYYAGDDDTIYDNITDAMENHGEVKEAVIIYA